MIPSTAANIKQAIKTGIAGVASLYVSELLKLREGYWAAISAVIVMQSNVGAAVSASWIRLAGTAIGATVGGVFAAAWGANALAFGVDHNEVVRFHSFLLSLRNLARELALAQTAEKQLLPSAH